MQEILDRIKDLYAQLGQVQHNLEILSVQKKALLKEVTLLQQQYASKAKDSPQPPQK